MRTRPLPVPLLAAAAVLLSACTSGSAPAGPQEATDDAARTTASDVGVVQGPADTGHLCRYVSTDTQRAITGADWTDPVHVTLEDSRDSWVCQARDGQDPIVRVAIHRGEGVLEQQRAAAAESGLERGGPAHLGEAYLGDRQVTALTRCRILGTDAGEDYEPYSFVVQALPDGETDLRRELTTVATAVARSMDQEVGCSPKMALDRAPADDAASTTAP